MNTYTDEEARKKLCGPCQDRVGRRLPCAGRDCMQFELVQIAGNGKQDNPENRYRCKL